MPYAASVSHINDPDLQRTIALFDNKLLNLPERLILELTSATANSDAGPSALHDFIEFLEELNLKSMASIGNTIVHEVVRAGEVAFIGLLSQYDIDFNQLNARGLSPLHYLFDEDCYGRLGDEEYEGFFSPFMQAFLQTNADFKQKDSHGRHISHYAARVGVVSALQLLAQKGLFSNEANQHGMTPLHEVARFSRYQVIDFLFEHSNANPAEQDKYGNTALHFLFQEGNLEDCDARKTIEVLLSKGGQELINIPNNKGETPVTLFQNARLEGFDREQITAIMFCNNQVFGQGYEASSEESDVECDSDVESLDGLSKPRSVRVVSPCADARFFFFRQQQSPVQSLSGPAKVSGPHVIT